MGFLDKYQEMTQRDPCISLKEEVRSILRDYRNFWDVYAELLQNSVDAINRRWKILNDPNYYLYDEFYQEHKGFNDGNYVGKIDISIDTRSNKIKISDNGVGIREESIINILLPKFSGKKIKQDYGFKGYGLTFVAFVSREFSIKTRYFTESKAHKYEVKDIFDWIADENAAFPVFPEGTEEIQVQDIGIWNTIMEVRLDDDYQTRFDAVAALDLCKQMVNSNEDVDRFEYILRTKTAIGNTKRLFSQPPIVPIDITLQITLPNGNIIEREIPYEYYHPSQHEEISVSLYEFANYVTQMNSANFTRGFRGLTHGITSYGIGTRTPIVCDILITAISSTRLGRIEESLRLHEIGDPGSKISCGIYLSINGMPTGIRLDSWDKKGGSFKRYYVVVDCSLDISNTLDSGRKGITSHYAKLIDESVQNLINSIRIGSSDTFSSFASRDLDIGRGTPPGGGIGNNDFLADVNLSLFKAETDKQISSSLVSKVQKYSPLSGLPHSEQEVVALFYSLLSRNIIKGYRTIYQAGSEKVYDAAFDYKLILNGNVEPDDPIGFGRLHEQQLRSQGLSEYNHSMFYAGKTVYPQLCVEFKQNVGGLLYELGRQTNKEPNQIDLLVVWDTSVPAQVPGNSYTLASVVDTQRIFHGTTHRLGILGSRNTDIFVISLKDILENLP